MKDSLEPKSNKAIYSQVIFSSLLVSVVCVLAILVNIWDYEVRMVTISLVAILAGAELLTHVCKLVFGTKLTCKGKPVFKTTGKDLFSWFNTGFSLYYVAIVISSLFIKEDMLANGVVLCFGALCIGLIASLTTVLFTKDKEELQMIVLWGMFYSTTAYWVSQILF